MIYHVSKSDFRISAVLSFLFFCVLTADAGKCRILLENENEIWNRAFLTYRVFNADGTGYEESETTVEMAHVGGPFWMYEVDEPTNPQQLYFSDGQGRVTQKFNGLWDIQWPENICFKDAQTSIIHYDYKSVILFDVVDRNGWLDSGLSNVLTDIYYAEDGTLFHAWSHKNFEANPHIYLFGASQGETVPGIQGRVYHFALVNAGVKSPCIWMRRADSPSNAIVAPVFNGATVTQSSDDCPRSVYASYAELFEDSGNRNSIIQYDMDGFAIPYKDGEFTFEWTAPKERISQLAFTLTPGANSFVAGAIAATDASKIEAFNGYHRFTTSPADAWCAFESNAGRDPSIEYANKGNYDIAARVSLRFDNADYSTGKMNFSAPPVNPLIATMRQIQDEGRNDIALRLSIRWNPEADFTLSDGRKARGAIAGIAVSSLDCEIAEALARSGGFSVQKAASEASFIIDTPDVLRSIDEQGYADIVFAGLPPYRSYGVALAAVPADDVSATDRALMNFGYREAASTSSTSPQIVISAPSISFSGHRIETVDIPLAQAKALSAEADMPQGPGATYYTVASRIHTTCRLEGLLAVPDGWKATYRLIAKDGSIIAETTSPEVELHGLSTDASDDLRAVTVYTSEGHESESESGWRPTMLPDGIFPEFTAEECDTWILQKAAAIHSLDCGAVYDLAFECRHHITRDDMPSYIGFRITAENAEAHNGHIAPSQTNDARLMPQTEHQYNPNTGISVSGNAGYTPLAPGAEWTTANDWARALARNGRSAFYIHHFHCEKPLTTNRAGADEAQINAAFDLHTPLVVRSRPALSSATSAPFGENDRLYVHTVKASEREAQNTHLRISLTDIDNIATGMNAPTAAPESGTIYTIQGIPAEKEPDHGIYIRNGRKLYKQR